MKSGHSLSTLYPGSTSGWCSVLMVGAMMLVVAGCASVPLADTAEDARLKSFPAPPDGTAALYIFRDSHFGAALKKTVIIDSTPIGESAPMTYFYTTVEPGSHRISTESEFGENDLVIEVEEGENYFIDQYIKIGVMVGGANVKLVDEEKGRKGVLACKLAAPAPGYVPYLPTASGVSLDPVRQSTTDVSPPAPGSN